MAGLASGQVDGHAFQSDSLRRDGNTLARTTVGYQHGARHAAADLKTDLVAGRLSGGVSFSIESAFFPRARDAVPALAKLAPDMDVGAFHLGRGWSSRAETRRRYSKHCI